MKKKFISINTYERISTNLPWPVLMEEVLMLPRSPNPNELVETYCNG